MRVIWNMTRWVSRLLVASVVLLSANQARATFIGLGDGTYDVTLTCSFFDCAPAGSLGPFTGSLTVVGTDVTAWSFAFPAAAYGFADVFNGNPLETTGLDVEFVTGSALGSPITELQLFTSFGPPKWNVFQNDLSVIHGTWTAVLQDAPHGVPEPSSAILILSGLAALGVYFTRAPLRRG